MNKQILKDYFLLTKPRVIPLLLVVAVSGMFLAQKGLPDFSIMFCVVLGGSLAAGGAQAINDYLEKDIDFKMTRTRNRPVASGRVNPMNALIFGITLNVISFLIMLIFTNYLAAILTMIATLIYVFIYTIALKRRTPQNIVIGGAAGAMPPVIGWAAVTGNVELSALYLFAIVFFWTPPHFWALSLLLKNDYAEANIPMLPVVAGVTSTKIHILLYTILLIALTSLFFVLPTVGWFYLYSALILGMIYLVLSIYINISSSKRVIVLGYIYSMLYLALLFLAMIIDVILNN